MEEINLKEIFKLFWNKKIRVFIIVFLCTVAGVIYTMGFTVPKYSSSTTLILTSSNQGSDDESGSSEGITTTDITLNSKLISTYSELIKSRSVLRQVISNLGINVTEDDIRNNVKVTSVKDTEIIKISVTNENSTYSAKIANEIAKVFADKVDEYYGINNVHVVDEAEVTSIPSNINHVKDIIIFFGAGLIVSIVYIFLLSVFDTTIKSSEDVERLLDVPVLVAIPACDFEKNTKTIGGSDR